MHADQPSSHRGPRMASIILGLLGLALGIGFFVLGIITYEIDQANPPKPSLFSLNFNFDFLDIFSGAMFGGFAVILFGSLAEIAATFASRSKGRRRFPLIWLLLTFVVLPIPSLVSMLGDGEQFQEVLNWIQGIVGIAMILSTWVLGIYLLVTREDRTPSMRAPLWINLVCLLSPILLVIATWIASMTILAN